MAEVTDDIRKTVKERYGASDRDVSRFRRIVAA
jgi:hypothetical protein